jgi:PAS domain S-box-containing protein
MKYQLQDIIDIEQFQNLQDKLNEIYSFPSAIIDNDGNILTATAWQDICTQFHRKNKDSERHCIQSDQYILSHIHEANPAVSYRCPHGLVDNATPIIIDGIHYGNYFTGQFFLEKPNMDFFRTQAKKYGFDEEAYLEAVRKVPIWTQEQLNNYLFFIKGLIAVISESGLKRLKEMENLKQIEKSEERHRSIIQAALDSFWLTDINGQLLEVNDSYCRMSGYREDELLSLRIADLDAIETPQDVHRHMQDVIENGAVRFETKHQRKDGSIFDVEISVQFRHEEGGRCVCFLRDISERKQAEQQQRDSEEKFRSLAESSQDYIMRYDRDCRHTYMNPAALAVAGVTEADIVGKTHLECGFPEDLSRLWEEKITRVFETGKPSQSEFSWESANGMVHLDWRLTPEFDDENRVMSVLGVSRDITERKQAEEKLRELEERFRLTFYTSPDAVNINKMDGTYLEINDGFTQLTGYTRKEAIGKTSADISIWDIPEDRDRLVKGLQQNGFVRNLESRFRMKDGSFKIALMSATIIQLKGEQHILSITRDITDFRKAEKDKLNLETQLQQAQKMESVGRLAGGVAHDFNNMLGVILGHAELAMEGLDPSQPIFADLQQIKQAADRSTDITRQLLTFARKQIISPKTVNLNEAVAGMLKMLLRLIGEDIDLAWLPGKGLWPIKIDPSQIDQVLANLCVNARDAIAGVGKITVGTGNCTLDEEYCSAHTGFITGQYVKIEVSDNGSGMDKETVSHIFEPFFTTKGVNEGTGLGLATVYGIVKQNNGFINVYSEQGQGTTFTIYLPRHVGTTDQKQLESMAEPALRGNETVLLVEDEPTILVMTTTMLQRLGYKVLVAGTPSEAIRLADGHSGEIHLLLTDVIMPEMNGKILTEKLTINRPELKCLFMSGYTADVISHHGVLDDGVHFIQKPFAKKELAAKIRQALSDLAS